MTLESQYINIHQDLIELCRQGDRDAQFKIYKLYYKAMYNTSLRIVNDTSDAEDIMQEAFLDAFQHLGGYAGEGSFGSWLKKIVINRSLDHLRQTKEVVSIEQSGFDMPEPDDDPDEESIQLQVSEVKSAIAQLPDDFRVIISLFLLEGYDHEEISQILNISNQLSRTRYSRARQKLLSIIRKTQKHYLYSNN